MLDQTQSILDPQVNKEIALEESVGNLKSNKQCCNFTPYILMIALSTHATFEGIALGLQTEWSSCLAIVIAIGVHKGAEGTCLGVALVKQFPNDFRLVRLLVLIFALATPIGVIIGILASGAGDIVNVIMSSMAGGTFIYIGCSEIIVEEFSEHDGKFIKLIAYMVGALLISSLSFIPE